MSGDRRSWNRHQAVAASCGMDEVRAEPALHLVEAPSKCQQRRMHSGMGGIAPEQPCLDEITGGGGLGALCQVQHQRRLLRREADLCLAELDHPPCGVELEASEQIASGPAGASLYKACSQIGVDVRHRNVALDEVRASSK